MRKHTLSVIALVCLSFLLTIIISWKSVAKKRATTIRKIEKVNEPTETASDNYIFYVNSIYNEAHLKDAGLSQTVFEKAVTGFYNLKKLGLISAKPILTIADFDQLSIKKRLYIIDLNKKKLLLNTWVAHGQNSGGNEANNFSNRRNSLSSSLGFYITGETYFGAHGKSLRLDGMDKGFNDNARNRSIVVHGANYVSNGTINALGRLGHSQGCPAVAPDVIGNVINAINSKTVLFVNKTDSDYQSKYLNETLAANFVDENLNID
jgi:hypothetical protein